jgi:predicted transcriptional regulator
MAEKALNELLKDKQERIESLEKKNKILFNKLYEAKQGLDEIKDRIRQHVENPDNILHENTASQ